MKPYKFVHEAPNHFILHDGESHFHIAKKGLDKATQETIKALPPVKMSEGGKVPQPTPAPKNPFETFATTSVPASDLAKAAKSVNDGAQKFSDGGTVTPVESTQDSMRKAFHFADGGVVDPTQSAQDSMRKAFHFADGGGPTDPAPEISVGDLTGPVHLNSSILPPDRMSQQQDLSSAQAMSSQLPTTDVSSLQALIHPTAPTPPPMSVQPVAPTDQVSYKTPQAPVLSPGSTDSLGNFDKSMRKLEGANTKIGQAQAQGSTENAKMLNDFVQKQQQQQQDYAVEKGKLDAENKQLFDDVSNAKIDPNRYWNNKSTGGKISAALGLVFGGIGSGMTHTPSVAAEFLQKSIQNDIEAQKEDKTGKMTLYKMGLEKYKDSQAAQQYATVQANTILQGQIQATAAKVGTPQALALAQKANAELEINSAPHRESLALMQTAINYKSPQNGQGPQSSGSEGIDPQKINLFLKSGMVPKEQHADVLKEYGEYIKTKDALDNTDKVFADAYKTANYRQRIADALPFGSHIPTFAEDSKQYQSSIDSYLDKLTKDLEGRVNPTTIDLIRHTMPQQGDSPETKMTKMSNIKDIIKGASSFPTLITNHILGENDPVANTTGRTRNTYTQGKPVIK